MIFSNGLQEQCLSGDFQLSAVKRRCVRCTLLQPGGGTDGAFFDVNVLLQLGEQVPNLGTLVVEVNYDLGYDRFFFTWSPHQSNQSNQSNENRNTWSAQIQTCGASAWKNGTPALESLRRF
jgi:hypothetical protein